jgi:hypothetical protein
MSAGFGSGDNLENYVFVDTITPRRFELPTAQALGSAHVSAQAYVPATRRAMIFLFFGAYTLSDSPGDDRITNHLMIQTHIQS